MRIGRVVSPRRGRIVVGDGDKLLDDEHLPASFQGADKAALKGQRLALIQIRWSLRLGVAAAATGLAAWTVGPGHLDVMAGFGAAMFLGALILTLQLGAGHYEEHWYRGRAIAGSIKTLAWRYAVGGDAFPASIPADEATEMLLERIAAVIENAGEVPLGPTSGAQVTPAMAHLRAQFLEARRESYIAGRIDDQMTWYETKARTNDVSTKRWAFVVVVANVVGLLGAIARFLGWMDVDVLGLAAAAAGAATAWSQLRQHRVLAASYALASQELSLVRDKLILIATDDDSESRGQRC